MKRKVNRLRNDFMDVVGSISLDELTTNQKLIQMIREIYQELTDMEVTAL
ncbi:MAG: hypothetical protein ACLGHN_12860 [Bacteriovoracia bacterium]